MLASWKFFHVVADGTKLLLKGDFVLSRGDVYLFCVGLSIIVIISTELFSKPFEYLNAAKNKNNRAHV